MTATHDLSCDTFAPLRARQWLAGVVRRTLAPGADSDELMQDMLLCISELVTNAYQAGCRHVSLRYSPGPEIIRVAVTDDAAGQPRLRLPSMSQARGRGLFLVQALSRGWGVEPLADGGKQVWVEFDRVPVVASRRPPR